MTWLRWMRWRLCCLPAALVWLGALIVFPFAPAEGADPIDNPSATADIGWLIEKGLLSECRGTKDIDNNEEYLDKLVANLDSVKLNVTFDDLHKLDHLAELAGESLGSTREAVVDRLVYGVVNGRVIATWSPSLSVANSESPGPPLNGNPNTGIVEAWAWPSPQLQFRGYWRKGLWTDYQPADASFTFGMSSKKYDVSKGVLQPIINMALKPEAELFPPQISDAFVDWWIGIANHPVKLRFGRSSDPVQFGPVGLLLNNGSSTWGDSAATLDPITGKVKPHSYVDGLLVSAHLCSPVDLNLQGLLGWVVPGESVYGFDIKLQLLSRPEHTNLPDSRFWPSIQVGAYFVQNQVSMPGNTIPGVTDPRWHLYQSLNPAIPSTCPAVTGSGIQCPALGSGGGIYFDAATWADVELTGELATWSDAVHGTTGTGYQIQAEWHPYAYHWGDSDPKEGRIPIVFDIAYVNYDATFYPPYGAAVADMAVTGQFYPGNARGFVGTLNLGVASGQACDDVPADGLQGSIGYFTGTSNSNDQSLQAESVSLCWGVPASFLRHVTLVLTMTDIKINGLDQALSYQLSLAHKFP